jgi:hypothetical protein
MSETAVEARTERTVNPLSLTTPSVGSTVVNVVSDVHPDGLTELSPLERQVLLSLFASRLSVLKTGPGCGKTWTLTTVAAHAAIGAGWSVLVCANTNAQVISIANRTKQANPAVPVVILNSSSGAITREDLIEGVTLHTGYSERAAGVVYVATAERAKWLPGMYDLVVFEEAYQLSSVGFTAVRLGERYLFVGDPGQIPPIVKTDASRFADRRNHALPAPSQMLQTHRGAVKVFTKTGSRRLGPLTVKVIAPFYDFEIHSTRPDGAVRFRNGEIIAALPEISRIEGEWSTATDARLIDAVVQRVRFLLNTETNGTPTDVFVAVSHVAQVSALQAALSEEIAQHDDRLRVATFNVLQGLEADAVVTIDPLLDASVLSEHSLEPGRLCVGLSRHKYHLTFFTTEGPFDSPSLHPAHAKVRKLIKDLAQ